MDIDKIRKLREMTNVGLADCKKALDASFGDLDKAVVELRKQGKLKASKLRSKVANEGRIFTYLHHDNRQACMVEVNCQTEFAADTQQFQDFCESVALQIISMEPEWLTSAEVPENVVQGQREIFEAQAQDIPINKRQHVVNQKLKKWFSEHCLMDQKAVVTSGKTIEGLREELVQQIQENVVVKRYVHWKLGN